MTWRWYKAEENPQEIWINKEFIVQLNLTGSCPLKCDFCYIKSKFSGINLEYEKIVKLWKNLRKYAHKLKIFYRVNITGGDIFMYPYWEEVAKFLLKEPTVRFVDPLINRFWKPKHKRLLNILKKKITFVQFNLDVVEESDIEIVKKIGKKAVIKISIYEGHFKRFLEKAKKLVKKFPETLYVSADLIIPQKNTSLKTNNLCIINNVEKVKKIIIFLKKEFGKNFWVRHPILAYLGFGEKYFCPVPFSGVYVFPDGSISLCPRYPHLRSGYFIENFDLIEYITKFQKLISTTCLFDNKYFNDFFKKDDNPLNFMSKR